MPRHAAGGGTSAVDQNGYQHTQANLSMIQMVLSIKTNTQKPKTHNTALKYQPNDLVVNISGEKTQ